jgi:hypothetical protein
MKVSRTTSATDMLAGILSGNNGIASPPWYERADMICVTTSTASRNLLLASETLHGTGLDVKVDASLRP